MIDESSQQQEIVKAYSKLSDGKYISNSDGNISVRLVTNANTNNDHKHHPNRFFLITPSGVAAPDLTADQIVLCESIITSTQRGGGGSGAALPHQQWKPSSEAPLHGAIYATRPDVNAVVHTHSMYACALACCRKALPPCHYAVCELLHPLLMDDQEDVVAKANGVPCVECSRYETFGTQALSDTAVESLGRNQAVLLANHGAVTVGATLEEALQRARTLEHECEVYWRACQFGPSVALPVVLTRDEIVEFQAKVATYGQQQQQHQPPAVGVGVGVLPNRTNHSKMNKEKRDVVDRIDDANHQEDTMHPPHHHHGRESPLCVSMMRMDDRPSKRLCH